jgi:hypothetical protein
MRRGGRGKGCWDTRRRDAPARRIVRRVARGTSGFAWAARDRARRDAMGDISRCAEFPVPSRGKTRARGWPDVRTRNTSARTGNPPPGPRSRAGWARGPVDRRESLPSPPATGAVASPTQMARHSWGGRVALIPGGPPPCSRRGNEAEARESAIDHSTFESGAARRTPGPDGVWNLHVRAVASWSAARGAAIELRLVTSAATGAGTFRR